MLNQASRPLYQHLYEHSRIQAERYHIPGHGAGALFEQEYWQQIGKWDVTETYGMDDLHAAYSVIRQAQALAAEAFGAAETWFLVNGTSSGILAGISGIFQRGDTVLVQRNAHKSVYNGLMLAGIHPQYIFPEMIGAHAIAGVIHPHELRNALERHPEAKGVIITSPTYYGHMADVRELANICRARGVVLFVDEAHGAHLSFHPLLRQTSALLCGADVVVQSAHKTLPSLTMAAMIHIGNGRALHIDRERLAYYIGAFQTTSPSYLVMASLDYARHWMAANGEQYLDAAFKRKQVLTEAIEAIGLPVLDRLWQAAGRQCDPLKLTIDLRNTGYTGPQWEEQLAKRQIFVEMAGIDHILLLLAMDKVAGSDERLLCAIKEIIEQRRIVGEGSMAGSYIFPEPQMAIPLGECISRGIHQADMTTDFHLHDCLHRTIAEYVVPYPPGIPLLCPGEVIAAEHLEYLRIAKAAGIHFHGVHDSQMDTLRCFNPTNLA